MAALRSTKRHSQGFQPQAYLDHLLGLSVLLAWMARWERVQGHNRLDGPVVTLGLLPSQRFALGFPARPRYGKHPFLALQEDEAAFCRRLRWAGAFVDPQSARLLLTTSKVLGDGENVEDIPALGLSLAFDHARKLNLLAPHGRLALRELSFDEEGAHVAAGRPLATLPMSVLQPGVDPFPPGACGQERSLADLVAHRLASTPGHYLPYEGHAQPVPAQFKDLVDPFDPSKVESVRAKD